ncbi:DNA polymerase alpha/epsilon subunit B-domain-containing protein [Syncephalis plumigaleata]|nr:DNA polymerase alpha/epsilon subunit B-domain-containing protein [Syncephalis plumigaleata]
MHNDIPIDHLLASVDADADTTTTTSGLQRAKREELLLKERSYKQQYANIYFERLVRLKPHVIEQARQRWSSLKGSPHLVERILDVKPGELCYIVGTTYHKVLVPPMRDHYYGEDDVALLEDDSGRIILCGNYLKKHRPISGVIIAALGRENALGEFEVADVCFAGLPPCTNVTTNTESSSSNNNESPKYLALVSGLWIGADKENVLQTQLLAQYLRGELGSYHCHITRVIIAGNTVTPLTVEQDDWQTRRAHRQNSMQVDDDNSTDTTLQQADRFLEQVCASIDVDIMPGMSDPASQYSTLNCVTNPHWCRVQDHLVLGNAGQPLTDASKYVQDVSLLDLAHMAPTTPDTLWCYPFKDKDPFIIDECPDIYFVGNQPEYATRLVKGEQGQRVRVVLLPPFAETGLIVLINLSTLDCHPVVLAASHS